VDVQRAVKEQKSERQQDAGSEDEATGEMACKGDF